MQAKNTTNIKGIDVSKWQGEINWNQVASDGVKYAFIKATEGTSIGS
ncbi:GH25 family lysozyme [Brevibacillus sp. SKDU10]|nr:GH25 family lysozyme [Brevibacillus sp. SKDU10]